MKQTMDENPPDLVAEMEESYSRLLQAIDKEEAKLQNLKEL